MDKTFEVYKISIDSSFVSRYKTIKAHNKKVKANSLKLSFFWSDVEAFAPFSRWSSSQDCRLNVSLKLAQDDLAFRVVWKIRVVKSFSFWGCGLAYIVLQSKLAVTSYLASLIVWNLFNDKSLIFLTSHVLILFLSLIMLYDMSGFHHM